MSPSIPHFTLADMSARELAEEMVRRIPAHTPEWNNPQVGDPGRTIIDLVAWMGETILYRVNLLPRRQRLEFLRLLGLQLREAEPARGLLTLAHKKSLNAAPVFVPDNTRVEGPSPFETVSAVTTQPFAGRVYYKRRLQGEEADALREVIDDLAELYGIDAADPYATTALFEDGKTVPGGIDPFSDSVDSSVWIALLALDETEAAKQAAEAAFDAQPALLNIGAIPQLVTPDPDPDAPEPPVFEHFEWSITSTSTISGVEQNIFLPLQVEADNTQQFTRDGTLRLVLPVADAIANPENDIAVDADAGVGERPPRIDSPDIANRVVCWLRLRSGDTDGTLPLSWLGINAVEVDGRETRRQIEAGISTGKPAQVINLPGTHVERETFVFSVQESGRGFVRWFATDDLGAADRNARVFQFDAAEGVITLGDGLNGFLAEIGARFRIDFMRSGGGIEGNVAAGTLTSIEQPGLGAEQPAAFHSGRRGESLEEAEKRLSAWLQHHDRCVTAADYRAISSDLDLARVEVLPRFRPYQQRDDISGTVSVLALPHKANVQAPNPRPDRRLIERVRNYLEPRRPLGTELFVIAPDYIQLGLAVAVRLREGFAQEDVVRQIRETVQTFLWPLSGGGRDSAGWPLGQTILNAEIELITARVAGVHSTAGASLFVTDQAGFVPAPTDPVSGVQTLELERWQLPEVLQVDVAVGATTAPTSMTARTGISRTDGTAVPVVPELC